MLVLTLGVSTVRAAPDSPKATKSALEAASEVAKPAAANGASERCLLTGSYIPQQFRQDWRITTDPQQRAGSLGQVHPTDRRGHAVPRLGRAGGQPLITMAVPSDCPPASLLRRGVSRRGVGAAG